MDRTDRPPEGPLLSMTQPDTDGPAGTGLPQAIEPLSFEDRFRERGLIGRGGMGRVQRHYDRILQRTVAIKFLSADVERDPHIYEARIAARLQHPNIAPVYEIGTCADGRRWLSMREVVGRDLRGVLREADDAPQDGDLRRLVGLLHRVCEAMAYVHDQGVVHRDLKPSNIRIGEYGEVVVLDWGIAGEVGAELEAAGTRDFMAPEQADGAPLDPRMDVYALGALLDRVLAGRARPEADPLRALARQATATSPADRPPHAGAMAEALGGWLDGADDRAAARRLVDEAKASRPEIERLRAEAEQLSRAAADALDALPAHAPVGRKAQAWRQEDRAAAARRAAAALEVEYESRLDEAWRRSAEVGESRRLLGDLYRDRIVEAERARDRDRADAYAARLEALDHEHLHAEFLTGDGALTLLTDPPGAEVWASEYELRARRLTPGRETSLGRTPLRDHRLPRGDWQLRIARPGRVDVIYPVSMGRGDRWEGIPPGETAPLPIRLPEAGALGDDERYVPAGWFWSGGDPLAADGLPRRRFWVDGFVMTRDPLTYRVLLDDLAALVDRGDVERARLIAPLPGAHGSPVVHLDVDARGVRARARDVHRWSLDWPVIDIDWHSATAWAAWRAERTGQPWRLMHSLEREKAARGVDGRTLPWGNHLEATWANLVDSRAEPPWIMPVHAYETDVGPYGVRGLVGNVREWCIDAYTRAGRPAAAARVVIERGPPGAYQNVRGGGWASKGAHCRVAARFAGVPTLCGRQIGVRLARSLGEG